MVNFGGVKKADSRPNNVHDYVYREIYGNRLGGVKKELGAKNQIGKFLKSLKTQSADSHPDERKHKNRFFVFKFQG